MKEFFNKYQKSVPFPSDVEIQWRISAYAIVLNEKKEALMIIPAWHNLWELPGGGVETKESIHEGIIREYYEETGYTIIIPSSQPRFVSENNFYHRDIFYHSVNMYYQADLTPKEQNKDMFDKSKESGEVIKIEWVALDKLNKDNCHYSILELINKI